MKWHAPQCIIYYGQNKTNRKEIHCSEGTQKTTGCPKDRPQERTCHHRCQETPQIQTRNSCPQRNQEISEIHWSPHQKTPLPETRQRNCPRVQTGTPIPKLSCACSSRIRWGLPRVIVWGHQLVRHPRQESDHHDQRFATCQENQRR